MSAGQENPAIHATIPSNTGTVKVASASPAPTPPATVKAIPPGPPSAQSVKANPGPPDNSKTAAQNMIVSPRDPQSGLPTGQRMHKPIMITKQVDKASPILMQALATNRQFKEVVIEFYRNGALSQRYKLTDVIVSSLQSSPSAVKSGNAKPGETLTLMASEMVQEK